MRLRAGEAHVWTADLSRPGDDGLLTDAERARAGRIAAAGDRARWVAARGFLRATLARYVDPVDLVADVPDEKPALRGGSVEFNLAHSGDVAMLAICTQPVGIDVEAVRADRDRDRVARRAFAPGVADAIAAAPDPVAAFYVEWTRHEARAKCAGTGLFGPVPEDVVAIDVTAPAGFAAALATRGPIPALTHCQP